MPNFAFYKEKWLLYFLKMILCNRYIIILYISVNININRYILDVYIITYRLINYLFSKLNWIVISVVILIQFI